MTTININSNVIPVSKEPTKVGDVFINNNDGTLQLLSQTDARMVALISIDSTANRWSDPVEVSDVDDITEDEFRAICNYHTGIFEKVKHIDISFEL